VFRTAPLRVSTLGCRDWLFLPTALLSCNEIFFQHYRTYIQLRNVLLREALLKQKTHSHMEHECYKGYSRHMAVGMTVAPVYFKAFIRKRAKCLYRLFPFTS